VTARQASRPVNPANVRLALPNRPENVTLIRQTLTGIAETLNIGRAQLDDIKTAVSEAANNVVLHAYDGGPGPLTIEASLTSQTLAIVVADQGSGIKPHPTPPQGPLQGIGLAVIQALTDSVEFRGSPGQGTEVRMEFHIPQPIDESITTALAPTNGHEPTGEIVLTVGPRAILSNVLGRLATALAIRAHFTIDRLNDLQLLTDTIAAHSSHQHQHLTIALDSTPHQLNLHLGPLPTGQAQKLIQHSALAGPQPLVTKLTNEHRTEPLEDAELLHLEIRDTH
jgi:anti-sigma regulatory factor (Ser/Thr protein kinase)